MMNSETTIAKELSQACTRHDDWASLGLFPDSPAASGIHIAVMAEPYLRYIFEGRKAIESRFSIPRIAPYGTVAAGDIVLLKKGPIVGAFTASSVEFVELSDGELRRLRECYSQEICADAAFWQDRAGKKYATLIGVSDVKRLTPVRISKQDRRGWLTVRSALSYWPLS